MAIASVNPATGETLMEFEPYDAAEIERRLALAESAFRSWRRTTFRERAELVVRVADVLGSDEDELARTMTTEMGKPVTQARAEVRKCANALRFYAEHAEEYMRDEPAEAGAKKASLATYQPLGPVLAVMPWNFPLWQVIRFAAPALMAGNVGLLKHASSVPQTALAIEDSCRRAGLPEGVFQTLLIGSGAVPGLIADRRVKAVTLTGSEAAGQAVASRAAHEIKKSVLELGGSDPFIVMPSADLERAAEVGVRARVQNNGQSCIAAKRFILHEAIADEFERLFVGRMERLVVGDPMEDATELGPLASAAGRDEIASQVDDAVARGAGVLTGGSLPEGPGFYYPPTVLSGITSEMRIHREETFGPVAPLFRVGSAEEAIALANDSDFGLGASVFSEDPAEQERFIADLESGAVFVNWMTTSYPELPFGGVKRSGYGRELAAHGLREFALIKTVWVD
jgi:succinate-semialdehyde dehydrogenase/glutarate-semialdehyde dehydrogenase